MSAYKKLNLKLKSKEELLTALTTYKGSQWTKAMIEVHETPTNLVGYHGDMRQQKANIIIRRCNVGNASNDLGFLWNEETQAYDVIVSDFDSSRYNQKWLDTLSIQYGKEVVTTVAKENGFEDIQWTTKADGTVEAEIEIGSGDGWSSGSSW